MTESINKRLDALEAATTSTGCDACAEIKTIVVYDDEQPEQTHCRACGREFLVVRIEYVHTTPPAWPAKESHVRND